MDKTNFSDVLNRLSRWCDLRERSELELRDKLRETGLNIEEQESIITKLRQDNFLNEKRFARAFARGKFRINKWGRLLIRKGLISKGISGELIEEALGSIDEETYLLTLDTLLKTKVQSINKHGDLERHARLVRFAYSKGYEQELAYESIRRQQL